MCPRVGKSVLMRACVSARARACSLALVALLTSMIRAYTMLVRCHFGHLSRKRHDFREKLLNVKHVFSFSLQLLSENIFRYKKNLARYCQKMWEHLHVKYPLFSSDFNETCVFSTDFRKKKKAKISSWIKIRSVEAELFHANGQIWRS